jgi:ferritin-like metal-binding protein YciE
MQNTQDGVNEFIDKCTARWLFEKTGVELYDDAIAKCPPHLKADLEQIRDEEKDHEEMLERVIRKYGADPHTMTESARITMLASEGVIDVVKNENFEACMDALLAAEAVDNVNWELLVELADQLGDKDARKEFKKALDEETEHLTILHDRILEMSGEKLQQAAA